MITMSACIVIYFHTSVEIFLRMMAGVGITVSRSITAKFQLEITFPNVLASVLSTCVGHILFSFSPFYFHFAFWSIHYIWTPPWNLIFSVLLSLYYRSE